MKGAGLISSTSLAPLARPLVFYPGLIMKIVGSLTRGSFSAIGPHSALSKDRATWVSIRAVSGGGA